MIFFKYTKICDSINNKVKEKKKLERLVFLLNFEAYILYITLILFFLKKQLWWEIYSSLP